MTELEKHRYERNLKMYNYAMTNPYLTYEEVGEVFGIEKTAAGVAIRKMHKHLATGEPYFKSKAPKTRPKRGKYNSNPPQWLPKTKVKDPEAEWAALSAKGIIPPKVL